MFVADLIFFCFLFFFTIKRVVTCDIDKVLYYMLRKISNNVKIL